MITRILKLNLKQERISDFILYAESILPKVLQMPGCKNIDLLQDKNDESTWFIYTIWESEASLNKYRKSEINIGLIRKLKEWLAKDFQAWMVENMGEKKK